MFGTNSTQFHTLFRNSFLLMVFFVVSITASVAQTAPSCACKGSIQVSVDANCEALITAEAILASGSTCGGTSTATVVLMKTPTGGVITQGVGSATLPDGVLYVGKTIYGKVIDGATGLNSCWTTIKVEDKLAPVVECPDDLTLTCYQMATYCPEVTENCSHYTLNIIDETIQVNDCKPSTGLPAEVLKVITRTYQAVDESGNKSVPCSMTITVVGLPSLEEPYVNMPANRWLPDNTELKCDDDYAKIPAGQPFAGNPSPVSITVNGVTKPGTGIPYLLLWNPRTLNAGVIDGDSPESITLIGGTDASQPNARVLGAEICFTSSADQTISFDWSAFMRNNAGVVGGGQFNNDEPVYSINGVEVNLPPVVIGVNTGSGNDVEVELEKGDLFCFRVYTMNRAFHTVLTISDIKSNVPAAKPSLYLPVYPTPDLYCNILVSYTDVNLPEVGCVKKIMRTWTVIEWSCRGIQRKRDHIQMIEIVDKEGPEMTCPKDFTVSTSGHTCEAYVAFPAALVKDNCSSAVTVDITYPGGIIKNVNGGIGKLPVGCHTVTYTAYDHCYNSSTCTVQVTVEDNTAPVAICDQNTVVSLTLDGKAWVPATSFDDGSYDDCQLAKMLVRRMDPAACQPCKIPEFSAFTYLGDYGSTDSKHYYYISKHRATPDVAIKTAAAMGGYVVAINTAAEDAWVYDKVRAWNLGEDYLIGLRDIKQKGLFAWLSGETSSYRNWASGNPKDVTDGHNDYDYVRVLDVNGKWEDFGSENCQEGEWLYVVEITDPCGFSEYAQFCCTDIRATPHVVVFRVVDKAGNWNDCMVNAFVQDKLPPSITCPPHRTIHCDDYFDVTKLTHSFGWPTAYDNCTNVVIKTDSVVAINSCRIGKITRNFRAYVPGTRDTARCTQIIVVDNTERRFEMTANRWPLDVTVEGCEDPNDAAFHPDRTGRPNLIDDHICSLVGADWEDQIFYFNNNNGDACFKILRHWTVIDWCQPIETYGGGTDYKSWTHTQVIKVYDPVKPRITSSCAPKSVCTYDPTCSTGYIELTATGTDVCTKVLSWHYQIDENNDGSFESGLSKSGTGNSINASGNYKIGNHKIVWAFEDRCGNVTKCEQLFSIVNCKAPTPYCLNGLATSLMPMDVDNDGSPDAGMVEIWAKDFDNGSSHPCHYKLEYSFRPVTRAQDGTPVLVKNRTYTCDSIGKRNVNIYFVPLDANGKVLLDDDNKVVQDYCSTYITIQDNFDACDGDDNRLAINGNLMTETEEPVKEVNVVLEGSEMKFLTDNTGEYNFEGLNMNSDYVVRPKKTNDYLNGVSTLDLVMIQRHILGLEKLNSPYKMIAADINKDKKVTASDLTELRKLVLGITNAFESNDSWRFVDKSYSFQDAQNAQAESFPEVYFIDDMSQNMNVNFTAVKIGDVNGNVVANTNSVSAESRAATVLNLTTANQTFSAGQTIQVPVVLAHNTDVTGFQFTVNFDNELFNLTSVNAGIAGMTDNNFGFTRLADGMLTVSYNKELALALNQGDVVMTLTLKARDNGMLSEGLWIGSEVTRAEAYNGTMDVMNVDFSVENRSGNEAVLYQNNPNPFKAATTIGFDLPSDMKAKVSVYDVTGKTMMVINADYRKGYNTVEINKNQLGVSGVYYYTLEAGDFRATRKMVIVE